MASLGQLGESQLGGFVLGGDTESLVHVTQELLEALYSPEPSKVRVTQELLEALYSPTVSSARVTQEVLEALYLTRVTYGFNDCGEYLGPVERDVRLFDSSGTRKSLLTDPTDCGWGELVHAASFEYTDRGGFGQGRLEMLVPYEYLNVDGTESVEVWLWDTLAYRGYLRISERDVGSEETATLTLYGLSALLDQWRCEKRYAYGIATDISVLFERIVNDFVKVSGRLPSVTVETHTIAVTVQTFDASGMTVAQALNALLDISPDTATWGHDVTTDGGDRLYIRLRSSTVKYGYAVGGNVTGFTYPQDMQTIVNRLWLTGGAVDQPNLIKNGSWEYPLPNSETTNNLLLAWSFEDAGIWTGSGSLKKAGDTGAVGAPHSGIYWLELDNVGEYAEQTVTIQPEQRYTASMWYRREVLVDADPHDVALIVEGKDAIGDLVVTFQAGYTVPTTDRYRRVTLDCDFGAYPTVTTATVRVRTSAGGGETHGVLVDDVALYLYNGVGQDAWASILRGSAKLREMDWTNEDYAPRHGRYILKLDGYNITVGTDALEVYVHQHENYISVLPGERYTLAVWWRTADGVIDTSFSIGAQQLKSDYTQGTQLESATVTDASATWTLATLDITAETAAVYLQPFIRMRGGAPLYVDAAMVTQGDVPYEVEQQTGYWQGESYERRIDVTDANMTELTAAAAVSITSYGAREGELSNQTVRSLEEAIPLVTGYFNAHAVPEVSARVGITGAQELVKPDGLVRVTNLPTAPEPLWPPRITYRIGDSIDVDIDLGAKRPEMVEYFRFLDAQGKPSA